MMTKQSAMNRPAQNAPCPCGSGKKYKRCCGGRNGQAGQRSAGLQQVIAHYQHGNLAAAGTLAEQLLADAPQDTALLELSAAIALQTGDAGKAADRFRRQAMLEPDNALAHSNLCMALHTLGRNDEALVSGQLAIRLDPRLADAWNNLGNVYKKQKDLHSALQHYEKALELEPNDPELHVNAGSVSQLLGDLQTAERHYRSALKLDRRFASAHNNLGTVLQKQQRHDEAEQEFSKAIELQPENPEPLINMSTLLLERGDYKKAALYLEEATRTAPNHIGSWITMGNLCERIGDHKSARNCWQRTLELDPENDLALCNIGFQLLEQGEHREARGYLVRALNSNPNSAKSMAGLGRALLLHDSLDKATEYIEKALALAPWDINVRIARAQLLGRNRDDGKTIAAWHDVIEQDPTLSDGYIGLAEHYLSQGRYDAALAQYHAAEASGVANFRLYHAWSQMEEQMHHLDRAEELAQQAAGFNPNYPGLRILQAKLATRHKDYPAALELLHQVNRENIPTKRMLAEYLFNLGAVLDKQGRYREAFAAYREANEAKNSHLGRIYNAEADNALFLELKQVFRKDNWPSLFRLAESADSPSRPQPVFIVGFPRSGTSLLEQILGSHPAISPAGELTTISELRDHEIHTLSGSPLPYPRSLDDPAHPLAADKLAALRDAYLSAIHALGIVAEDTRWITDKMPHNATHLGLIRMMFPHAPIIHITRHPLNPCLSAYFSNFNSRHRYTSSLSATAQHYANILDLVEHYRNIGIDFVQVRYEDLVLDQESVTRRILEYIGAPWHDACLQHHKSDRVVRTASYEQVTQKVYTSSLNRYQNYWDAVQEIIPILQPTIERLGYTVEAPE